MRRRTFLGGLLAGLLAPRTARSATDKLLVVYLARGGWDPSFVFDPHFGDGVENDPGSSVQTAGGLSWAAASSRPSVSSFLQQHSSRAAIINGLSVGSISHQMCTRLVFTASRATDAPDFPTALGALSGSELALPTVLLSGPRYPGSLGGAQVSLNPTLSSIGAETLNPDIEAFLRSEADRRGPEGHAVALERLSSFVENSSELAVNEGAGWATRLDAGLQALALGLSRCVVVQGTTPVLSSWDSHSDNRGNQDRCFENGFSELALISERLDALGLRDRAVVLALSEMGRTPRKNSSDGKDHWPYTSLMAWGSGVVAGMHGRTDTTLAALPIDDGLLTPARLAGGLLERFDVDPAPLYGDATPWRGLWS